MSQPQIFVATQDDANAIKQMINEMYGFEYETRTEFELKQEIHQQHQIYILAKNGDDIIGFAGASTNSKQYQKVTTKTETVIEYIYIIPTYRNYFVAFELIKKLLTCLVQLKKTSTILQVQTFNKYRFFHYALSDKNIIKSTTCTTQTGVQYDDQILIANNIEKITKQTAKQFMLKVKKYKNDY